MKLRIVYPTHRNVRVMGLRWPPMPLTGGGGGGRSMGKVSGYPVVELTAQRSTAIGSL